MDAIIQACKQDELSANVQLVICDKESAPGLEKARKQGIHTEVVLLKEFSSKEDYERRIVELLNDNNIDFVCLAGYMKIVGLTLLNEYESKMINIHPSLLPSFKGLSPQRQALDCKVKFAGCTVHFVTKDLDNGPIIDQEIVKVDDQDTEASLSAKILEKEHILYPRALKKLLSNINQ